MALQAPLEHVPPVQQSASAVQVLPTDWQPAMPPSVAPGGATGGVVGTGVTPGGSSVGGSAGGAGQRTFTRVAVIVHRPATSTTEPSALISLPGAGVPSSTRVEAEMTILISPMDDGTVSVPLTFVKTRPRPSFPSVPETSKRKSPC